MLSLILQKKIHHQRLKLQQSQSPQPQSTTTDNQDKSHKDKQDKQSKAKDDKKPSKAENLTDPDSRIMKTATSGFQQSYNAQIAVDKDTQLITATDVNQNHNDQGQLHPMIDRSEENTKSSIELVYADGGYSNEKDLNKLEERNTEDYVAIRKAKNSESKKKTTDKKSSATHHHRVVYATRLLQMLNLQLKI